MKVMLAATAIAASALLGSSARAQGFYDTGAMGIPAAGTSSGTTTVAPYSYYAAFPSAARQYVGLASTPGAYSTAGYGSGASSSGGCASCGGGQAGTVSGYGSGFGGQDFPFLGQPYGHVYDKFTWNYMAERTASRFNPW